MLHDALTGVRVLDFTHVGAGPTCTQLLGDMGADVIKVEPLTGDLARKLGPPWQSGQSAWFMSLNRNKRSIAIDLKSRACAGILRALLKSADIVVESFRPGVADKLGFGFEHARAQNASIVYCSISAYGQTGPWRDRGGVDGIIQANSGLMSTLGHEGSEPCKMPIPIVDMTTGYLAANAILASLFKCRQKGAPQRLDISMFNCSVMLQQTAFAAWAMSGELPPRSGSAAPYAAPNEAYPTQRGWLMIAAYQENQWRRLCKALNLSELSEHPDFASLPLRVANRKRLKDALAARLAEKPASKWESVLHAEGIMCAEVADYNAVAACPPFAGGQLLQTVSHGLAGAVSMPRFGLQPSPDAVRHPPPALGQHTRDILADLGLTSGDIDRLLSRRAILAPPEATGPCCDA